MSSRNVRGPGRPKGDSGGSGSSGYGAIGGGGLGVVGKDRFELHSARPSREPSPTRGNLSTNQANSTVPNSSAVLAALGSTKPFRNTGRPLRSAISSREPSPVRSTDRRTSGGGPRQSNDSLKMPKPTRPIPTSPNWPASSRFQNNISRSPSVRSAAGVSRKTDSPAQEKPSQQSQQPQQPQPQPQQPQQPVKAGTASEDDMDTSGRTPRKSPVLATVVESSLPTTPLIQPQSISTVLGNAQALRSESSISVASSASATTDSRSQTPTPQPPSSTDNDKTPTKPQAPPPKFYQESESDTGYRSEAEKFNTVRGPSSRFGRGRRAMGEGTSMTVETETSFAPPSSSSAISIRSKKSNDTIRAPKKEKKKTKRTPAIATANPSSKADMFAARIAEAVDEANSSDSDETFVYESNPREPQQRPSSRFHSRTPSATSIHGGSDPRGRTLPLYPRDEVPSSSRGKMKFVNANTVGGSSEQGESHTGEVMREMNRPPAFRNTNFLAEDAAFFTKNSGKRGVSRVSSRNSSRPGSPSHRKYPVGANNSNSSAGPKKAPTRTWARYDADADDDDERVPLIPQGRRNGQRSRRGGTGLRYSEQSRRSSRCARFAGCVITAMAVVFVIAGAFAFLFTTTKSLVDVKLVNIADVLVSQEEIMLQLEVEAVNPNVIAVTVQDMDINLFAKSAWVASPPDPKKPEKPGEPDDGDDDREESKPIPKVPDSDPWLLKGPIRLPLAPSLLHLLTKRDYLDLASRSTLSIKSTPRLRTLDEIPDDSHDHGTDPIDIPPGSPSDDNAPPAITPPSAQPPPEEEKQTMLLGRIYKFDSPLTFDGSPVYHRPYRSSGELRLAHPGNATEEGGTERWERVLKHEWELIVRGVLNYQVPLSGRLRTVRISGRVLVTPDESAGEGEDLGVVHGLGKIKRALKDMGLDLEEV